MTRKTIAVLLFLTACALLPNASALPGVGTTLGPDVERTVDRTLDRIEIHYGGCAADDFLCQLTCEILDFGEGYKFPNVQYNPLTIVVPGPGEEEGEIEPLGHWTICLAVDV